MTIAKQLNSVPATVGERLLGLRRRHGLTQAEYASRLGIAKSTYVAWERDEAEPPLKLVAAVRRGLGTRAAAEVADLLGEPEHLPRSVDWVAFVGICKEVETLAIRAGYKFAIVDIVEIAGIIFDRGEDGYESGLRDAEQLLRIGKRLGDARS